MSTEKEEVSTSPDNTLVINEEDIKTYFEFLGSEKEIFTAWMASEDGTHPIPELTRLFAPADKLLKVLRVAFQKERATLHVLLNRTSDQGRRAEHVQSVRCLCLDLDEACELQSIKEIVQQNKAELVVESSPGKYHVYWRVDRTIPLEVWSTLQSGIAEYFGGDANLSHISHSIRVPGVPRVTKSGEIYVPRIVWLDTSQEAMDLKGVHERFPWIYDYADKAKEKKKEWKKANFKLKKGKKLTPKEELLVGESRNRTLFDYVVSQCLKEKNFQDEEWGIELGEEILSSIPQNGKAPLTPVEIQKTVRSALKYALEINEENERKNEKKRKDAEAKITPVEFQYDYENDRVLRENRFTEAAIKARALQRFGARMLRVKKLFYAFNEQCFTWNIQTDKSSPELTYFSEQAIKDTVNDERFIAELGSKDGEVSPFLIKRAQERFNKLGLIEQVSKSLRGAYQIKTIEQNEDVFDRVNELILTPNGVLDMLRGEVRTPVAEDYLLNRTPVQWDKEAECPGWKEFLREVFEENENSEDMLLFMQELFGYSLSGLRNTQQLFCHLGDGSNGKSKVLDTLRHLGGSYSVRLDPDDLISKTNAYTQALERIGAAVEGHRVVIVDDISTKVVWNEGFVKNLTGSEVVARALYQERKTVQNRAKIHMGLNTIPSPENENYGLLRRLCIIPYQRRFEPTQEASDRIDAMMRAEASGIFKWAIEGFQRYVEQHGFTQVNDMKVAVEQYKEDHFGSESIITTLFRAPNPEEINKVKYTFLTDIVEEMNDYARQNGGIEESNPHEVGRAIRRNLKIIPKKIRCPKRGYPCPAYQVVRKYERKYTELLDVARL